MELRSEHFRKIIFYNFNRNSSAAESLANLTAAFCEQEPSRTIVFYWFQEFRCGRASLKDEQRAGRPVSVVHNEDLIAAIEKLETSGRFMSYMPQDVSLGLLSASLNWIRLRELFAHWIPHLLT